MGGNEPKDMAVFIVFVFENNESSYDAGVSATYAGAGLSTIIAVAEAYADVRMLPQEDDQVDHE